MIGLYQIAALKGTYTDLNMMRYDSYHFKTGNIRKTFNTK